MTLNKQLKKSFSDIQLLIAFERNVFQQSDSSDLAVTAKYTRSSE